MDMLQILAPDGTVVGEPPFDVETAARLYAAMLEARIFDRKCSAMQRQGRLATYAPFEGQEAAQIGAAAVLGPEDWLVASYRDAAANWYHGYPWVNLVLGRTGDERGGAVPEDVNALPPSITVGAHMIHAVGIGWAQRLQGTAAVAMTMFGDGATSEGDFHEAMNFAGVYKTPTVFVCQNNGFAISMPRERQTAADHLVDKASGYGMPGVLVDGNDVMAMAAVTGEAVERARRGEGPTFIEAVTFRIGPHTTTDDAGRYRDDSAVAQWQRRDPVHRLRRYLENAHAWSDAEEAELASTAAAEIEEAVAAAESLEPMDAGDMFDRMFATPTAALDRQRAVLRRERG